MGRGRGKGKRLTAAKSHDPESGGEEVLPSYRRRGRPQKPLKDEVDNDETGRIDEEEEDDDDDEDDVKGGALKKEAKGSVSAENGKKRKRPPPLKDSTSSITDEIGPKGATNFDGSLRSNGFRQNGSRRKNTPRRAAEAGVECT